MDKKSILIKNELFFKEISLMFDLRQIYEDGFFVMIDKKTPIYPDLTKVQRNQRSQKTKWGQNRYSSQRRNSI